MEDRMTDARTAKRRGHGRLVVATLALVMVLAGCDWAQFGYSANHTRDNPTEKTIGIDNVASLTATWTGVINLGGSTGNLFFSSPSIANGVVYVGSVDHKLYAFDTAGATGCSGAAPKSCVPMWTAATGGILQSSPAVVDGVVYVASDDSKLYAFDAAGVRNCSGTPKTCSPLWTATTGGSVSSSPAVVNGVVYLGSNDSKLHAFDAAGVRNCSGTPKTCAPLWVGITGGAILSSPAVAKGVVYVASTDSKLYAFDAGGVRNCAGTPKTCAPLWTATTGDFTSSPAVVNGVVYVGTRASVGINALGVYAFDAAGLTNCAGIPKTCSPMWAGITGGDTSSSPAVANGVVYIGRSDGKLYAFDAAGGPNCFGPYCQPLWSTGRMGFLSSPTTANGVVYIGSEDFKLYAFDAAGTTRCSGTPKTCTSLWTAITGGAVLSSPTVANGAIYVGSDDGKLHAFGLAPR
jgi:outer membrane protein assembly factor BamB